MNNKYILVLFLLLGNFLIAQRNIQFRSQLNFTPTLSNLWGYTDTSNGKEYAIVGHEYGTAIVDVSNPDYPQLLFEIPGDTSIWREPKVWNHYAYVTNEKGGGLLIIDLQNLPLSITYQYWTGNGPLEYKTSHTPFIDESGKLFLNGSKGINNNAGTIVLDLNPNPLNPTFLGMVGESYVHDCYVRNDTFWAAEIYTGSFSVWNINDLSSPELLSQQNTPMYFTHNGWLSNDGNYFFTTDERPNSSVTSYDVSDLNNIIKLDEYRSNPFDNLIPHNTYILPDSFLYTSYYRHGVTIADASRPQNIVETGWYDTSPFPNGQGFEGCWGVYPFFPSGNIICSDREEGLFVLTPIKTKAAWLEGVVRNNNIPITSVQVEIMGQNRFKNTDFQGIYRTGTDQTGSYDIRFYAPNLCYSKIVSGVQLTQGQITTLDVNLDCFNVNSIIEEENFPFSLTFRNSEKPTILIENQSSSNLNFELVDLQGKLISNSTVSQGITDLEFNFILPKGSYFASLQEGNNKLTKKIIIY